MKATDQASLIQSCRSMSSQAFFHLLPHDVLYGLFLLCVKPAPDPWTPVILSQVCTSWRFTALSSPILWTGVVFSMSHRGQKHLRPRAFLKRSLGLPISIHIYVNCRPTERVGSIITRSASRLCSLTLTSETRPDLIMDSIGFLSRIPFRAMESFRAGVPGGLNFQVVRKADHAVPFFMPYCPLHPPGFREFLWFGWDVQHVTSLSFKGLGVREGPSMEQMCAILHGCRETLQSFDFEGWAPSMGVGSVFRISPITLPVLRSLRLAYIDDISILATCIVAPHLRMLAFGALPPTIYPHPEGTHMVPCNLPRVFRALAPSCAHLTHLALVGVGPCARDAVDAFFDAVAEVTALVLSSCHPSIARALFQPEARFRTPKAVLPKLSHLRTTLVPATDLARLLLRHKTIPALKTLERLEITEAQLSSAYPASTAITILGHVLELNKKEGMLLFAVKDSHLKVEQNRPQAVASSSGG